MSFTIIFGRYAFVELSMNVAVFGFCNLESLKKVEIERFNDESDDSV